MRPYLSASDEPRFKLTSVTGFGGGGGNADHFAAFWQVLDSAYCYALVWEFFGPRAQARAERCCAELNAGRGVIGGMPHGSELVYNVRNCRCAFCRAAHCLYLYKLHPVTRPGRAQATRNRAVAAKRETLREGGYDT